MVTMMKVDNELKRYERATPTRMSVEGEMLARGAAITMAAVGIMDISRQKTIICRSLP